MIIPKYVIKIILLIILLPLVFYSCTQVSVKTTKSIKETSTNTDSISPIYSITPSPTGALGKLPRTPQPAPSGIPPTWRTPLATYSPDQANKIALNLYENNTCTLPCWWGITPGKTSWLDAWQFLGRFSTNRYPWETLLQESNDLPGYMYFQVKLDFPKTPNNQYHMISTDPLFVINIKTFDVDFIDLDVGDVEAYSLSSILEKYGKPKEIYIFGGDNPIASGIEMFLYYPQYGFISAHYTNIDPKVWTKSEFSTCFSGVITSLFLWPSSQEMDFTKRLEISIDSSTINTIKPLDKVSNITVDDFYNIFLKSKQYPCVIFYTAKIEKTP